MLIQGYVRYQMTKRLELARHGLLRWNCLKVGDIFKHIEGVEVEIANLQMREDEEGGL